MTEDEARRICADEGAIFTVKKRGSMAYIYVTRWLPRRTAEALGYKVSKSNGQNYDRYVCPLAKLDQLTPEVLRQRIASLPVNPNKLAAEGQHLDRSTPQLAQWHAEAGTPATSPKQPARPKPRPLTAAAAALLATIPTERTGVRSWAAAACKALSIPTEQLVYRLAVHREALISHGVRLAQSTRYRTLFIPTIGQDEGAYYSHIWREGGER